MGSIQQISKSIFSAWRLARPWGVFFCFYVVLLWSLEQRGHYKRKKKKTFFLHLSSGTNFAWKPPCADLCDWAECLPVTCQGKDKRWAPSPLSPWFPPRPALQLGTFSISSSGKAGNWLFLWNEHDPEKYSAWSARALERILSCTSHQGVSELLLIKAQLEPTNMCIFQGNSNRSLAPNDHDFWLACLCGNSEKFRSTRSSSINGKLPVMILFNRAYTNQTTHAERCIHVCLAARHGDKVPWIWVQNLDIQCHHHFMSKSALLFNS